MDVGDLKVKVELDRASIDALPDEVLDALADRLEQRRAERALAVAEGHAAHFMTRGPI